MLRYFAFAALVACGDQGPDPNAPQNPTPNPQYPSASTSATAAATAPPATATATATATAQPVATTTAPPPTATATATVAQPQVQQPPPAFPTFSLPNFQLPNPAQLAQVLPSIPLDPNLLNQIKQVGEQIMTQGGLLLGEDTGLKAASVRYAPLMIPEGAAYKDSLTPGSHKAFDVTLAGNKCYTIIAYSPPGQVTNVDLHLLVPPLYNMDAGHDDSNDSTAVIGKAPAPICPFTLIPIPYRVDVHAKAGQGRVMVQVYSKSK
ncbi:MAG TPA: hypothetical protein VH142_08805 [Polyangiaceae bacterium]|jgi:hypothetical protein|nr:hypothetical protein [Polyangiaceae bacterium]